MDRYGAAITVFVLWFAFALSGVAGAASDDFKSGIVTYHTGVIQAQRGGLWAHN